MLFIVLFSKIAFHLLERLDEELWKRKPNAISLQVDLLIL